MSDDQRVFLELKPESKARVHRGDPASGVSLRKNCNSCVSLYEGRQEGRALRAKDRPTPLAA
jgi:hypothetical protein